MKLPTKNDLVLIYLLYGTRLTAIAVLVLYVLGLVVWKVMSS